MGRKKIGPDGPCMRTYYKLGLEAAKAMPVNHSCAEIGRRLGITKSGAWQLSVVTLGKLIYRLRKSEFESGNRKMSGENHETAN